MSELALKLIAENKRSKSTVLDLGNCGLTELPDELGDLVWLETLILSSSWLGWDGKRHFRNDSRNHGPRNGLLDLTQISRLSRLQTLIANSCHINNLSALSKLRSLQSLDLQNTKVKDLVPLSGLKALQLLNLQDTLVKDLAPLSCLLALQSLNISGTQAKDLSPLRGLHILESLNLGGTQITDLSPLADLKALKRITLSGTQVYDISPLSGLDALELLYLGGTNVLDIQPLSKLSSLQSLDLRYTNVTNLEPLSNLNTIQLLDLSGTKIIDLTPLSSLGFLHSLYLSNSDVTDITPLSGNKSLKTLFLDSTNINDLSPLLNLIELDVMVNLYPSSSGINIGNCPLTNPPLEIVAQGNEAILNYFRERDAGGIDHLYEAKMLILGEGGAGKTSLLRRLYQPNLPLPEEQETTKGIAIHRHDFLLPNGRNFRLNVWDFGGQEIYHATHQFFLTRRSLYVLLDDTRSSDKSVSDPGFKKWLDIIELFGGDSPVLIFQNEKGGRSKTIDFDGIRARFPQVMKKFSGNLEHQSAAVDMGEGIDSFVSRLPHIGESLPAAWIKVRADIETAAQSQPYITLQTYQEIYQRHLPANRVKALHLSQYLHDLGVFLHFQDDKLLAKTVILQNQWATEAVYRLLDDETIKAKKGRFSDEDCARLWMDSDYADMHPELVALMRHFELCYLLPDSHPTTWLAPQLLDAARPQALRDWQRPGDLVLRYGYAIMPRGIISRLLVRLHRFVPDPDCASINSVLFQQTKTAVLATLSDDGREIELRARGPERKALLSVVAADLEAINNGFQGLRNKVDKLIPCDCPQCSGCTTPYLYEEKRLRKRVEDRELKIECPISYKKDVDVLALLDGIRMEHLPPWAKKQEEAEPVRENHATTQTRTFKIFLASSSELKQDRDQFDLYFRQLNDRYINQGIYLKIVRWENFLDAMSSTRKQDEYNMAASDSDVFVSLFSSKAGKFTEEEFDAAFGAFKNNSRPYVYTYFKETPVIASSVSRDDLQSLWKFQDKLTAHGHNPTKYESIDGLKLHFLGQLDKLLEAIGHEPVNIVRKEAITVPAPEVKPGKGLWQKLWDIFR